jgi:MFS family permease
LIVIGVLTGPIFDMGYFRTLLAVGSFLTVFGMMMTSISTEYHQIFLAQGVCVGLGSGCLFIPSVAIVVTYFNKKRSFAVGLAASGSSLGKNLINVTFTVFHIIHSARWRHLSRRVSPTTTKDWLWLGDPCHCLNSARHPRHLHGHHETPS